MCCRAVFCLLGSLEFRLQRLRQAKLALAHQEQPRPRQALLQLRQALLCLGQALPQLRLQRQALPQLRQAMPALAHQQRPRPRQALLRLRYGCCGCGMACAR